jgi:uncharacterized phage protein (TIGR01671 family)
MRQIKFRAWDKQREEMWKYVLNEMSDVDCYDDNLSMWSVAKMMEKGDDSRFVFMQYTGLKDRNGTEIYEGDILLVTSETYTNFGKTPTGRFSKEYYEVIWKDDGWGYKVLKSDHTIEGTEIKGLKVTTKYAEVIGNIYEHPHLLEGAE